MKIFITGGLGFVGSTLAERFLSMGYEVTVMQRSHRKGNILENRISFVQQDGTQKGEWQEILADHDVIVNLAGVSIFGRWTKKRKKEIYDSRIKTTENISEAIRMRKGGEILLLSASAAGFYGFHGDEILDEESKHGNDFLAKVANDWEREAKKAEDAGARVVLCRFGIVMGKNGGPLLQLKRTANLFMGSSLGNGKQWVSWIHEQDLADIMLFCIENKHVKGPVNFIAPNPVTNKNMLKELRRILKRPALIPPVPALAMRIALGEFGNILLKGQRAAPKKLEDAGFLFKHPDIKSCFEDLLKK